MFLETLLTAGLMNLAVLADKIPARVPQDNGIIAMRQNVDKALAPLNAFMTNLTKAK